MKKKRVIDLSFIRIASTDTDAELMVKVRQAFPELLRKIARRIGGVKNPRSERERFIREAATEYLRELTAPQKQEIALQVCAELKTKRDLMPKKSAA